MKRNYTILKNDLVAEGFSEAAAFKIVDFIEIEDLVVERLHAAECRDRARHLEAFIAYWVHFLKLQNKYQLDAHVPYPDSAIIGKQMRIEGQQRRRLLDTGQRDKSVFLVSVLKYFCELDDPHMLLVIAALESSGKPSAGVMDMTFA
jgi:hypothetical protein